MKIVVQKNERTIDVTGGVKTLDLSGEKPVIDGKTLDVDFGEGQIKKKISFCGNEIDVTASQILNIDYVDTLIL